MIRALTFFACVFAALASATVGAQTLRFSTATAYPGDVVTVDVWYEAGGDAIGFDFAGRFEPPLQIVAFRAGDYAATSCNVIRSANELRAIGVHLKREPLPDHRVCSVDLRVSIDAAPGWHGLVFSDTEPSYHFVDADGNGLASTLHGGGVYVIRRAGTCSLVAANGPSPDFVPAFAPICDCLRSADHPLHRCGIRFGEDFVLWREFPPTSDPRDWVKARWMLLPLRKDLPDIHVTSESLSGQVWADDVRFDQGAAPLEARTLVTGFKVDGAEALDRLQIQVKYEGQEYRFEQRLGDPPKD